MDEPAKIHAGARRRRWLGRGALAVLAPAVLLAAAELTLRAVGAGEPASFFVPAGDDGEVQSNHRFGAPFFGARLARPPLPLRLARDKPPGVRRVFVLGGSAARGEPDPAFSLARTLAANLALSHPDEAFEVLDTGLTAANSHVVLPVARECLDLDPDLLVVYLGNNEVVGPFGLGPLGGRPPATWLVRLVVAARATRVGQLLARLMPPGDRAPAGAWGGMAMFLDHAVRGDDPRLEGIRAAFARNLEDLCAAAGRAGVPVLLATVAVNLNDQPPLLSLPAAGTAPADSARCAALVATAERALARADAAAAAAALDEAAVLGPQFAQVHYLRGRLLAANGRAAAALPHFRLACRWDALRFRADAHTNEVIRGVAAARGGAALVDVAAALADADHAALFLDHVHFSHAGNRAVGRLLYPAAARTLGLAPTGPAADADVTAWLGHTLYDSWEAAVAILAITGRPPFSAQQGARDRARAQALERQVQALPVAGFLQAHAAARRTRPDDPHLLEIQARLLQRLERDDEAIALWSRLLAWYPGGADWLLHRGEAFLRHGASAEAIADFRRALAVDPQLVSASLQLARALAAAGEQAEALDLLDDLLTRMPDDVQVARLRGIIRGNEPR
ncbi:MAG: tetratricopeptide repeat protein [Candidatus Krumholzibacteriia bacterium]